MFPSAYVRSSKINHVKFDDSIEDSNSNNSELEPGEDDLSEIGMLRGLIFSSRYSIEYHILFRAMR